MGKELTRRMSKIYKNRGVDRDLFGRRKATAVGSSSAFNWAIRLIIR